MKREQGALNRYQRWDAALFAEEWNHAMYRERPDYDFLQKAWDTAEHFAPDIHNPLRLVARNVMLLTNSHGTRGYQARKATKEAGFRSAKTSFRDLIHTARSESDAILASRSAANIYRWSNLWFLQSTGKAHDYTASLPDADVVFNPAFMNITVATEAGQYAVSQFNQDTSEDPWVGMTVELPGEEGLTHDIRHLSPMLATEHAQRLGAAIDAVYVRGVLSAQLDAVVRAAEAPRYA